MTTDRFRQLGRARPRRSSPACGAARHPSMVGLPRREVVAMCAAATSDCKRDPEVLTPSGEVRKVSKLLWPARSISWVWFGRTAHTRLFPLQITGAHTRRLPHNVESVDVHTYVMW